MSFSVIARSRLIRASVAAVCDRRSNIISHSSAVIDRRYKDYPGPIRSACRQNNTTSQATSIVVSVWLR